MIQDLFFILTMLVLAQCWNLLAGYAGLISVGQQAFVGFGAYALFAFVSLLGLDPLRRHPARRRRRGAGRRADRPSSSSACTGPISPSAPGSSPKSVRLLLAQWKALGGGTGTSLPRDATRDMLGVGCCRRLVRHALGAQAARCR